MPGKKKESKLHTTLLSAARIPPAGPVNTSSILRHKSVVFEKASSLLGYHKYLTKARSWKAAQKGARLEFEREVQTQAAATLSDMRELAAASLRITGQMKQAGHLDRALGACIAGIKAAGPVRIQEIWEMVESEPKMRQMLKDQGLTDEMWGLVRENMKKLDGRISVQGGKLAAEVKGLGQDQLRRATFAPSPTGLPRTVTDLLKRGQFERVVEELEQAGPSSLSLDVVAGEPRDLEVSDVILGGMIQSIRSVAQHKRKLEDTGLATYAGNEITTVLIIIGVVLLVASVITVGVYCGEEEHEDETLCKINAFLLLISLLFLLGVGLVANILSPNKQTWRDTWTCVPDPYTFGGETCYPPGHYPPP